MSDADELNEYRQDKRQAFENAIKRNKQIASNWIAYMSWEEGQGEFERARSVLERALEYDPRNPSLWLRGLEMEQSLKNVNRARNLLDRVTSYMPRVDTFWYKYVYMEEVLENVAGARLVFERWMKWNPGEEAWMAYVKFERRYHETEKARTVFQRFVSLDASSKNWLLWAKFEESLANVEYARTIYEECIEKLGMPHVDQNVFVSFAKFETRMKEVERARAIYKMGLESLPKDNIANLYNEYVLFEKQFGGIQGVEEVVTAKRRAKYETELEQNSCDYDIWFDYIRLEESRGDLSKIRDLYERAIANVPLNNEKRYWKRYIYLWLFYAGYAIGGNWEG